MQRPQENECAPFYINYINELPNNVDIFAVLIGVDQPIWDIPDGFYQSQFKGAPVTALQLEKIGDAEQIDDQIIAISGATVTSEAVVKIFNTFLLPIKEKMQEQNLLQ